ncbi:MAG: prolyl oligopeptidase family serine peptidase [Bacteroidetes bacterium]|uniref:Prolyl oligopeptidase family serine peptidase n=1 Tax=Candidatus Cryptobacteroides intestinigallinarum TaxID=2840767 RepID=A0A9D9N0R7_9BACT|nr:prolyl oligopeptidase family serine peptidase [Candidatus Cryptobacteroides intestinigallinarum]
MKRTCIIVSAALLAVSFSSGKAAAGPFSDRHAEGTQEQTVPRPNYALAERFSQKKISQMVFSTAVRPNWFRDSDRFWYSWKTPDGTKYYIVDARTGKKQEIFDMDRLAMQITQTVRDPFDAQHLPIEDMELKDDKKFTFSIKSTVDETDSSRIEKYGKKKVFIFEYEISSGKLSDITGNEEPDRYPLWANVSPDGKTGIFAKNANLYWMDAENMAKAAQDENDSTIVEHRITVDGTPGFGWGGDNYMGWTETDTTKRVFPYYLVWSPDSRHFAAMKYDMTPVKELWVINSLSNPRPTLETYRYQMPGEPGPKEYLYVFDASDMSSSQVKINAFKDQTIEFETRPQLNSDAYTDFFSREWLGDGSSFYIRRLSRDLKRLDICRVDVGSDSTHTVISERMNTYVESRPLRLVDGGRKIIQWSERNGWANLYLYNANGSLANPIVEGPFHVEDVLAVNDEKGYIIFSACGYNKDENPYQMHTFRVGLDGSGLRQIDMDDMDVKADASDDAGYLVYNYSRVDAVPASALYSSTGKKIADLETADLSKLFEAGYRLPERFTVKAADGVTDLYGVMYKPFDFDSTKVYPIIEYVYPGPQVEANNISWSAGMTRTDRLAQIGFIVITVGNRGGHPNRSKWYHNYGYGNLRDYGLEDQKTAVQRLAARYSWIDGNKVGIHGHSGGGFMSTAAILKYPDFYTAAVSCAGNHDNSIYNRWWSEQHHGILEKITEEGDTTFIYKIDTNPEIAQNLKGHLLLVHGDIDNNVHPANTIRVVNALIRANKRFDMLILPGQRHGFGDMNEYFFWRLADWFSEYLLGESQSDRVDIVQLNND